MARDQRCRVGVVVAFSACVGAPAVAQLRVASWNISNYAGGRQTDLERAIYAEFEGRAMRPDVITTQEFLSQGAVTAFLAILNQAPGSPGDWAAAAFIDGPDTDCGFFYRTGRAQFLGTTIAAQGSSEPTNQPRHTYRYDFRPVGYSGAGATIACYSSHMKAGSSASDQARRLVEAQRIRADAAALPAGWSYLLGGDFNIQQSSQAAYQALVGAPANPGQFVDPIATPGDWNNNGAFRFVHTQDPVGAGGMDDRHDQILIGASLADGGAMDYVGAVGVPYSTVTWADQNHSYRAWGNDGTSYNVALTIGANQMVGPVIAQALVNAAAGAGHLPVFLDLRLPAKVGAPASIDFGTVALNSEPEATLAVSNAGDIALWSVGGLAELRYSMSATAGFAAPVGMWGAAPGSPATEHAVHVDATTLGVKEGAITITSDDPDEPVRVVPVSGVVVISLTPGDANGDQRVDFLDLNIVLSNYGSSGPPAVVPGDVNADGNVDFVDLNIVLGAYGFGT